MLFKWNFKLPIYSQSTPYFIIIIEQKRNSCFTIINSMLLSSHRQSSLGLLLPHQLLCFKVYFQYILSDFNGIRQKFEWLPSEKKINWGSKLANHLRKDWKTKSYWKNCYKSWIWRRKQLASYSSVEGYQLWKSEAIANSRKLAWYRPQRWNFRNWLNRICLTKFSTVLEEKVFRKGKGERIRYIKC